MFRLAVVQNLAGILIGIIAAALIVIVLTALVIFKMSQGKTAKPTKRRVKKTKHTPKNSIFIESAPKTVAPEKEVEEAKAEPIVNPVDEVEEIKTEPIEDTVEANTYEEETSEDSVDEEDDVAKNDEVDEEETVKRVVEEDGNQRLIIIKYKKSFTAKLIQSSDEVKNYYSELKNELLSYKGVKSRMSWKYESFNAGRDNLVKIRLRGKNLGLCFALDPKDYADSKYIVDDMSEVSAYKKTPLLYRIKNNRRFNYSKELIATVMNGREKLKDAKTVDYVKEYPYENIEPLIARGLIKELTDKNAQSGNTFKLRESVKASEVNELIKDEVAVALIEKTEEVSDKTKVEIINIDVLSRYFENGEEVTLEEIKKRVPNFKKSATAVKVLARGALDKKLTVIADSFSIEAAKMIILTGGSAVKKKS